MTVGEKIKQILDEKGLKQTQLIRFLLGKEEIEGKERTNFSRYLSGVHEFPREYIIKASIFLKIDPKILFMLYTNNSDLNQRLPTKLVPIVGNSGCSVPSESYFKDYYDDMDDATYYSGDADLVYAIRAFGDSMASFINDGDICFFEVLKNNGIESGEVVHYSFDYGSENPDINGIKVYKIREDGTVYMKPLNSSYDIIDIKEPEKLIMSRLLYIQKGAMRF